MHKEPSSSREVKASMLVGVRWVAGARAISEAIGFGSTVVLARLIAPPEFGRAVIALIVAGVATVLVTNAFASLLVQQKEIDEDDVRAAVGLNVTIGLALSVIVLALAEPISTLTGGGSAGLIRAVSPVCFLAGINAVPAAMLSRRLDFRRLSFIGVLAQLIGVGAAVALAAGGAGAAAIVVGALVTQAASTCASVMIFRPPLPRLHLEPLRRLISFGAPNAAGSLLFTGFQNVDYAVIGARLGPTQLAYYYRAFQYGVGYQAKISQILANMAFPVYSRLASMDDVRAVRSRIVRVHAAVIFPLLAGYACLAPTLIPWMLGERWAPVVAPSQFMTVSGAVTAVLTGTGALMVAIGRPGLSLLWNLGHFVFFGLVVYVVAPLGIVTVAAVVAGFYLVQGLAAHWFLLRGAAGVPMRDLFSELLGPCTACAALAACAVPLRWLMARAGAPPVPTLLVAGAVGSLVYGVVMRYGFPAVWDDLELLVRRLLQSEAAQVTPRGPSGTAVDSADVAGSRAGASQAA